jgi:hypothetical protein
MTVVSHISNCPRHVQAWVEPVIEGEIKVTDLQYCRETESYTILTVKPGGELLTPLVLCPMQIGRECPGLPPAARR